MDRFVIKPVGATSTVGSACSLSVTGAGIPPITITQEALYMFGLPHRALGEANFEADGNTLTVANIGTSGADGVAIDFPSSGSYNATWSPFDPSTFSADTSLRFDAYGEVNGVPSEPLGSLEMVVGAAGIGVFADYDPVGSSTHRVQVYNGSTLVADFPNHSGQVATVGQFPDWVEKQGSNGGPGGTECMYPCWSEPTAIFIDGQAFLAVLIENPTVTLGNLNGFAITGRDITLRLTGETATPSGADFLPGDSNGDGSLNIADAIAVLQYLFNQLDIDCVAASDVNSDGTADISDPIYFLAYLFGQGAPPVGGGECAPDPDPADPPLECVNSGCP